jgi:hypothetical protein
MTKHDAKHSARRSWMRRRLPAAVALAGLVGGAMWYGHGLFTARDVLSEEAASELSFRWKDGSTYTYGLSWRAEQTNRVAAVQGQGEPGQVTTVAGKVDLSGKLVLRSHGKRQGAYLLAVSLTDVDRLVWQLGGEDVVAASDVKSKLGGEAFLEIEPGGRIRRTYFGAAASMELRSLVQWLVPELQFVLPAKGARVVDGAWSALEDTVHGRARTAYRIEDERPLVLSRARTGYETLGVGDVATLKVHSEDAAVARCAAEGHLDGIEHSATLRVTGAGQEVLAFTDKLSLVLESVRDGAPRAPIDLSALTGYALNEAPGADVASQKALENRVGNLTPGQLVSDVLSYANGGRMDQRWLWQATGLLELHPEACAELAAVFGDDELTAKGRALILDLLASAGTDEAQRVLRQLLDSDVAKADETTRAVFYNRVALVEDVNTETAQFAAQHFDELKEQPLGPMRVASTYALGSVAGHQAAQGNKALAGELNARLIEGLERTDDLAEKAVALRAMGNAGLAENVDTLTEYTRHESPALRAAAADALRDTHTEKSVEALLELLQDRDWQVQQAALSSLSHYQLAPEESLRIEKLIVAGVVESRNDPLLVTVLARSATPDHPLAGALAHVLVRNQNNGQLAARIRSIGRRNGVAL